MNYKRKYNEDEEEEYYDDEFEDEDIKKMIVNITKKIKNINLRPCIEGYYIGTKEDKELLEDDIKGINKMVLNNQCPILNFNNFIKHHHYMVDPTLFNCYNNNIRKLIDNLNQLQMHYNKIHDVYHLIPKLSDMLIKRFGINRFTQKKI